MNECYNNIQIVFNLLKCIFFSIIKVIMFKVIDKNCKTFY